MPASKVAIAYFADGKDGWLSTKPAGLVLPLISAPELAENKWGRLHFPAHPFGGSRNCSIQQAFS
jgi:hypothetical protein